MTYIKAFDPSSRHIREDLKLIRTHGVRYIDDPASCDETSTNQITEIIQIIAFGLPEDALVLCSQLTMYPFVFVLG